MMNDLISRQAAIDMFQNLAYDDWNQGAGTTWADAYSDAAKMIRRLPSAQPAQEKQNLLMAADILLEFLDTDQSGVNSWMKTKDGVVLPMDVGCVGDGLRTIKQYAEGWRFE